MQYIFTIFCLLILLPLAIAGYSMAPWVPTRKKDIIRLIHILDLKKWEKFFEIGCGDGRVSQLVAKTFPKAKILWLELAYPVFFIAYMRKIFFGPKNYRVVLGNAFKKDFSEFDVIYVYGMPDKMWEKIIPKFMSEAKKGAKLYSYVFSIPKEYAKDVISYWEEGEAKIHVITKK